ncbi:hypothetical protein [Maridesulfovibrio hydrothermalis]|uniref:Uncharacterized protein n=1 Tax=Maridesulfovibrio hydrothermalis AM13 = DSM 14728 TaxID=1121451 RepID=L0R9I5_9BACT|nr:hypothetical protein [Maridesulfovibrio hydrothermalis]CCO22256.1 protein of unknown function [Maridesulfovibrio hydrothermalis AM13 = DSM 14728]
MSLMFLTQVVNFLNGDQNEEWTPFYINSVIMYRGYPAIFKGTNGIGKTTISKATLACLGCKNDFILHTKERMSPTDSTMSHIRVEFVRPYADPEPMQVSLPIEQFGVQGEHWVFGICGHKGTGDLIRYKYKGTIEDVSLGSIVGGKHILLPDEDVQRMVENADEGVFSVSETAWKKEVAHHIRPRQLRMLEKFQRQGAGDHSATLFDVQPKGIERYDQAFFYGQIVPELMDGLHSEKKDGNAEDEEIIESFEDTVVQGSQKLIQAKIKLEETKTRIKNLKNLQTGLVELGQKAHDYSESKGDYQKELGKVAEIGVALDAVSRRELAGVPKWIGHSDEVVEKLLKHMAISPGIGPCIRPQGIDELLGIRKGRTTALLSDTDIKYTKSLQPIEIIDERTRAKKGEPYSGSFLSLINSLDFIDTVPASVLKGQPQNELHRREGLKQTIEMAFAHFSEKMDTSPHRKSMAALEKKESTERSHRDSQKGKSDNIEKNIKEIEGMRDSMAKSRAAWETMRDSEEFYSSQLYEPRQTGECVQDKFQELDAKVSRLDQMIGGIGDKEKNLHLFRKKYGVKADPLQIKSSLEEDLDGTMFKKVLYEASFGHLTSEKDCFALKIPSLEVDSAEAANKFSAISNQKEAWGHVQEMFQGLSYETIREQLNEQERTLDKDFDDAKNEKRLFKEHTQEQLRLGHAVIKKSTEQSDTLLGDVNASEKSLQDILCTLKSLEDFRAEYGEETTPEIELDLLNKKQLKIAKRIEYLKEKIEEFKKQLNILETKQGAPSGIVADALNMVQEKINFQMLFEVIEAEANLSTEQKKEALELLSATLFAPVVESNKEAQVIANTFERKNYPIPVFLLNGFRKLLKNNELSRLSDAIFAHKSKMVDIILNKNEREALKARLEKKIVTYGRALIIGEEVAVKIGPSSSLAKALIGAQAAVELDVETLVLESFSEVYSKAKYFIHIPEVLNNAYITWGEPIHKLHSFENDFAGLLKLQVDQARCVHGVEEASFQKIESAVVNLHEDLSAATKRLQSTAEQFEGSLVSYEAERHKEAESIQIKVMVAEKSLTDFKEKFRNDSPFATNFALAKGFSDSLYEDAEQENRNAKANLKSYNGVLEESNDSLIAISAWMAELKVRIEKFSNQLGMFDFEDLATFITSGEGKDKGVLIELCEQTKEERTEWMELLKYEYDLAQEYVPQKKEDENLLERLSSLGEELGKIDAEIKSTNERLEGINRAYTHLKTESMEYDLQILKIQMKRKGFASLLGEIESLDKKEDSSEIEIVRRHVDSVFKAVDEEKFESLVESARAIASTLEAFKAESKVERAKTAKNKMTTKKDAFGDACDRFVEDNKEKILTGMANDLLSAKNQPCMIGKIIQGKRREIEEKDQHYNVQKGIFDDLWKDLLIRMRNMSDQAKDSFRLLRRVCNKYKDGSTFFLDADVASDEAILDTLEEIRDRVELQNAKLQLELDRGNISPKHAKRTAEKGYNSQFMAEVRATLFKSFFINVSIKFRHPEIAGYNKRLYDDSKLSDGQKTALQLLMVVRLAEYAIYRDRLKERPRGRARSKIQTEHSFILLDGMLSNLSDDDLISESLSALKSCLGSFQLIGFIHNRGYVNNYDVFPCYNEARKWDIKRPNKSSSKWVRVLDIDKDGEKIDHTSGVEVWHSAVVPLESEQIGLTFDDSVEDEAEAR